MLLILWMGMTLVTKCVVNICQRRHSINCSFHIKGVLCTPVYEQQGEVLLKDSGGFKIRLGFSFTTACLKGIVMKAMKYKAGLN